MKRPTGASISPAAAVLGLFLTFGLIVASFFPFLSIYFAGRGFDPSQIGFLLGAMAAVRIVAMPIWGHVADTRIGRRRALQLGLVGMVVFAIIASVLDSLVGVAFGAVGIALAMAASGPNIDALARAIGDPTSTIVDRPTSMLISLTALSTAAASIGAALGPAGGGSTCA